MENIKNKYGGDKYLQRLVSLYNGNKKKEMEDLLKDMNLSYSNSTEKDILIYSEYLEFKRKKFEFVKTTFDGEQPGTSSKKSNGRIVEMEYKEKTR